MKPNMRGVGIALITPFSEDGSVDFGALEALVERVTAGGADYLSCSERRPKRLR